MLSGVRHTSEVLARSTPIPVTTGRFEDVRFRRLLDRDRVRVLEDVRAGRLNPHGIGDWQLVEQGGNGLEQGWCEEFFVL